MLHEKRALLLAAHRDATIKRCSVTGTTHRRGLTSWPSRPTPKQPRGACYSSRGSTFRLHLYRSTRLESVAIGCIAKCIIPGSIIQQGGCQHYRRLNGSRFGFFTYVHPTLTPRRRSRSTYPYLHLSHIAMVPGN